MDEIIFVGVDIPKAVKEMLDQVDEDICKGMTSSEKEAYDMGIKNALSALKAIIDNEVCVHIPGKAISEEMDYAELKKIILK